MRVGYILTESKMSANPKLCWPARRWVHEGLRLNTLLELFEAGIISRVQL